MFIRLAIVGALSLTVVACSDSSVSVNDVQEKTGDLTASTDSENNATDSDNESTDVKEGSAESGSGSTDSETETTDSNPPVPTTMNGQVTAGYAECDVSATDLTGNSIGDSTRSDSMGDFSIYLAEYQDDLIITASNCTYMDEVSNSSVNDITLRSFVLAEDFEKSITDNTLLIQLTPFTELAFNYANNLAGTTIPSAMELIAADLTFDDFFEGMGFSYRSTAPVVATDSAATTADSASRAYGLALAAFSGSGEINSELSAIEDEFVNDMDTALTFLSDKLVDGAAAFELSGGNLSGQSSIEIALSSIATNAATDSEDTSTPATTVTDYSLDIEPGLGTTRYIPWEDIFTDADTDPSLLTYRIVGEVCGDTVTSTQELILDCGTSGDYEFFLTATDPGGNVAIIPATVAVDAENSETQAASFLMSATFGPTQESIDELLSIGYSEWFQAQLELPVDSFLDRTEPRLIFSDTSTYKWEGVPREFWFKSAVYGDDQLRQRAAFALSQLFVVATESRELTFKARMQARYMDIIQEGAFGNFRDLLEDVTYSPMMGMWLTYIGNQKADEEISRSPDENYAREVMQLFTLGLVELNQDGSEVLDAEGEAIEIYDNDDITELAKVFTGLWWDSSVSPTFQGGVGRPSVVGEELPMQMYDDEHSPFAKTFLGSTIPAGLGGDETISAALDIIFSHANIAPFISKQLIKRLTTSNPAPAYVERVADVFDAGTYTLPDGHILGTGVRGDLTPVWAAILFDPLAVDSNRFTDETYGKVREPIIRFLHWARFAEINDVNIINDSNFVLNGTHTTLEQNPYRAKSVFNFYRPGYIASGSSSAAAGLVAPEMQITHATTAINYANFMRSFINRNSANDWRGSYPDDFRTVADDPELLIDALDTILTAGRMSDETKLRITDTLASVEDPANNQLNRIKLAVLLTVVSQEYITQQ